MTQNSTEPGKKTANDPSATAHVAEKSAAPAGGTPPAQAETAPKASAAKPVEVAAAAVKAAEPAKTTAPKADEPKADAPKAETVKADPVKTVTAKTAPKKAPKAAPKPTMKSAVKASSSTSVRESERVFAEATLHAAKDKDGSKTASKSAAKASAKLKTPAKSTKPATSAKKSVSVAHDELDLSADLGQRVVSDLFGSMGAMINMQQKTLSNLLDAALSATERAENMTDHYSGLAQKIGQRQNSFIDRLRDAKDPLSASEAQIGYFKDCCDDLMKECSVATELWIRASQQSINPISTQFSVLIDQMKGR
ncbi:hypothetical protein JCM17846_09640 [Iodidimonas nitroreducens]|uniref:Phasin domain-containing protein n=1 Tax=Iodidimonas nitroreducens TaxID=1236968 RepID=A0A5A7N4S2_9PROT|nr:phasin family protein [Iodidimonas nitroreducens]GAK33834.1 phasin protein [alpha proteobacterium Q-1]GER03282.1 hypothetical protein JCM17846_09640 [Iodidimonas nitroreducens]